jgi:hypothetical protein
VKTGGAINGAFHRARSRKSHGMRLASVAQ